MHGAENATLRQALDALTAVHEEFDLAIPEGRIVSALGPRQVAKAFGAILRAARVTAGISQEVPAERADCDRTYPSLLERALRQPTIGKVIDIAGALHLEPAALVNMTIARLRERGVIGQR
jgi:hypothetical protein